MSGINNFTVWFVVDNLQTSFTVSTFLNSPFLFVNQLAWTCRFRIKAPVTPYPFKIKTANLFHVFETRFLCSYGIDSFDMRTMNFPKKKKNHWTLLVMQKHVVCTHILEYIRFIFPIRILKPIKTFFLCTVVSPNLLTCN